MPDQRFAFFGPCTKVGSNKTAAAKSNIAIVR